VSGGKDSTFAMYECVRAGHDIICLANLHPLDKKKSELDSFMFQTVGHRGITKFAEAMDLPLVRMGTRGKAVEKTLGYVGGQEGDEVEDLYELLKKVKEEFPEVEAVSSGAVFSDYQRTRVENVCGRLGLRSLGYLWHREQSELLNEMEIAGIEAIFIKTAAEGLDPLKLLGRSVHDLRPVLEAQAMQKGLNVCGEGGEYETFTLDCPMFKKRIELVDFALEGENLECPVAPSGHLRIKKLELVDKPRRGAELNFEKEIRRTRKPSLVPDNPRQPVNRIGSMSFFPAKFGPKHDAISETTDGLLKGLSADLAREGEQKVDDVAMCFFYISDMKKYPDANEKYKPHFQVETAPSRVCTELAMGEDQFGGCSTAALEAIAETGKKKTMHIESVSHWAPAMIGPYSQANTLENGLILMAGMIGLDPGTMKMVEGGGVPEVVRCWKSIQNVLTSLKSAMEAALCYVVYYKQSADVEPVLQMLRTVDQRNCVYIGVPYLPKNALVEIQTTAMTFESCGKGIIKTISEGVMVAKDLEVSMLMTTSGISVTTSGKPGEVVSIIVASPGKDKVDMDDVAHALKKYGLAWRNMLIVRLWISTERAPPDIQKQLQLEFDDVLQRAAGHPIAFSTLPVTEVRGEDLTEALFTAQFLAVKGPRFDPAKSAPSIASKGCQFFKPAST